ncbi:DNA repair protein RecO [Methylomarinum sp. Ch1-1]|uniref:DNA repair protein RecO n=1 Tax=Methylomarinum roseum TaxID=3067653 RepID=A0AAU7NSG5_9GAMM
MTESAVLLQPAFILQHRKYRESSLILDVLTRDHGVLSILAKGVKKRKSTTAGLLLPFAALRLSYQGHSDFKVLTACELNAPPQLTGLALFCGYYVNELVFHFLHKHDPCPEVYRLYHQCLQQLQDGAAIEQALRSFELKLIEDAGYALSLDCEAEGGKPVCKDRRYRYEAGVGLLGCDNGYIRGDTLQALQAGTMLDGVGLAEAKQLMRRVLDDHLQGKQLKSRAVLAKVIQYLH